MTGEPDLVSLLYHADWTRLSLSAEVSDGSRLLVAPGRRYRLQTPDHLTGCDGDRPWKLSPPDEDDEAGGTVHWISGPRPPLPRLLSPTWLLTEARLDLTGVVSACQRDALHVVATGKPGPGAGAGPRRFPGYRAEAVVDAELGIVLRLTWMAGDGPPGSEPSGPAEVLELVSLELSPVIDPAQFAPPPGSLIGESLRESLGGGGLAWQAVKTAGGLAAGGLGAWIRYSPFGHRRSSRCRSPASSPAMPPPRPLRPPGASCAGSARADRAPPGVSPGAQRGGGADTGRVRQVLCPVLVGRDEEARHLQAALAAAQAGRGGTVLLTGEAGIGKSRLVRETVRAAGDRGVAVLAGRAVAAGVPTPFRPFAEALAPAGRAGRLPDGDLDGFRPALGRLIPQWRPPQIAGDESLVFLGEAVIQLLRALCPEAGCLLILEDLHWADGETLALLEYLADNLSAEAVLCVGTLRGEQGAAARLAGALELRGSAAVVPLSRLDPAATARMALACLGGTGLPELVQLFVAERAEGVPFLVEEVLAGLIGDGTLAERDGRWQAGDLTGPGLPVTFADAVRDRLEGLDADSRQVLCAAAMLGRRFDWALLGPVTGRPDSEVVAALRRGIGLQLLVADRETFRFRHALTHEAVLAALLPPERALLAAQALATVETAHPGLPGTWCMLAAELAESAGNAVRAGELLLEAGRRDLAVGALASAEHTLIRARDLAGPGDPVRRIPAEEALTEVFALSGQVDRAIETGRTLLARLGPEAGSGRAAALHLRIARAAIAGARWAEAAASIEVARASAGGRAAEVDACAAQVAASRGDLEEAALLATAALRAAESSSLPEVACEALEVIGRVARQRDLDTAEQAFTRAAAVASAHGLQLWHLRALHELGTIDQLRTESVERLEQARELAVARGALALAATLDLQIAAGLNKQFRADEALAAARRSAAASRRFRLATLPMALIFQATAHAIRGEQEAMEAMITEAISLAPDDPDVLGCSWGHCRATVSLLAGNLDQAHTQMTTGAGLLLGSPATIAPPFLGLWPLLGALLGRDGGDAAARVRSAHGTRHLVVGSLLGYADAVLAGRQGRLREADAAFASADAQMGPLVAWYRNYARRVSAEAALDDGWGNPVAWLREAAEYFAARGDDRVAAACRGLLRRAGAPVPRRRPGGPQLPAPLRALGVTDREADVLRLAARGLGNREIAEAMVLSPRTVEKHVASLLAKTGLRRSQLAGYSSGLD